jgi:FkbM family methyltransferase
LPRPVAIDTLRMRLFSDRRFVGAVRGARAVVTWLSAPNPAVRRWRALEGDKTLRLDYDLSKDSTVLDVGGFEGQWASDIVAMYGCRVHVFEPVPEFAERIGRRFARNPLVTVHPVGLSSRDGTAAVAVAGDASSHLRPGDSSMEIQLRDVESVMGELGCKQVDLMKVNIEGAEYDLLDYMIARGLISRIRDLQVQFHVFVPNAVERMNAIRAALEATHYPTYQYDFLWENWRRHES